jgi:GntR family transcriptional regulator
MTYDNPMIFQIDFKSGKPVYLQLVDQVRHAAATGVLRPGEALPAIRTLAEELRVNRNTVAKAYTELESQGVVEAAHGKGCYLKENPAQFTRSARQKLLVREIDAVVVAAHHLRIDRDGVLALMEERLDHFERRASARAGSATEINPAKTP